MSRELRDVMLRLEVKDSGSPRGRSLAASGREEVRISPIRKKRSVHDPEENETERFLLENPQVNAKKLLAHKAVYDEVYEAWPDSYGKQISRLARDSKRITASSLVYGEITYTSFFATLEKVTTKYGGLKSQDAIFYDLGSGAGKPVIAAATIFPFKYCRGLEYLGELVVASIEAKERFDIVARPRLKKLFQTEAAELELVCADITDLRAFDWSDGDLVFANSTCFDDALMSALAKAASALRQGAFFITFTKRLPSSDFEICESMLYQMSWGGATVFIQRKITASSKLEKSSITPTPDSRPVTHQDKDVYTYPTSIPDTQVPVISDAWLTKLTNDDDSFGVGVTEDPLFIAAAKLQRQRALQKKATELPTAPPDQGGVFTL